MDENLKILKNYLSSSIESMSNYGKTLILNSNFNDITISMNSGTFVRSNFKTKIKYFFSLIAQYIIFKNIIFTNIFIKKYKIICNLQKRIFNNELIIHSIFLDILNKKKLLEKNVCVIGDGKANLVAVILGEKRIKKIYSVNLPQALIQDYLILTKYKLIEPSKIKIVNNRNDLLDDSIKLFMIPAINKDVLLNQNINLFINSYSFQEMSIKEVNKYIEVVKSNFAYLYSINREEKDMLDGNIIKYSEYGIPKNKIIFHEEAKFVKKFYSFRFPFIHKKKGKVLHTLAYFNNFAEKSTSH